MSSYLNQLKTHKSSLELTIKQCDNDIDHAERGIALLHEQKETIRKQIELIEDSISEEEAK